MKQILAVVAVVLFAGPAVAHIPDNCPKYLTEFQATTPRAEQLSQKHIQAIQNVKRAVNQHGPFSQEYIEADRHHQKINLEFVRFLVERPKPLLFMILCIDGNPKHQ